METDQKHSILYVDDEPDNLVVFKSTFRRYYTIYTATSGMEGLEIIKTTPISVIITDQRMPEMTGMQFLSQLPEEPENMRMILTGFSDIQAIIDAINSGNVYRYVSKPWDKDQLRNIIDQAIAAFEKRVTLNRYIRQLEDRIAELQLQIETTIKG
ncbi:MAG: response regulator [Bacteroidia bacterium]